MEILLFKGLRLNNLHLILMKSSISKSLPSIATSVKFPYPLLAFQFIFNLNFFFLLVSTIMHY